VRQQWNFSPPETTREIEDYQVELSDVTVIELVIVPDNRRGAARASLKSKVAIEVGRLVKKENSY
jgi:hypothetical protein